jgi:hypothetical protein
MAIEDLEYYRKLGAARCRRGLLYRRPLYADRRRERFRDTLWREAADWLEKQR